MRRSILTISLIAAFLLFGCGGGTKIKMPSEGVKLSYANAAGKTFNYRTIVDKYIQTSQQGNTITRLVKGDVRFSVTMGQPATSGNVKMTYKFRDVNVGVFENDQLTESEEIDDMKDLEMIVTVDSTGATKDIEGLDIEEEMRKEEISPLEFIIDFPIPQENITVGYSWHHEKDTVIEEENMKITQKVIQNYTVSDFVLMDSARVVICKITGTVNIHQVGEAEQEGKTYDVDITMNGDIKGDIYFDIDNSCVVKYVSNKMVDIKGHQIDVDTGEKEPVIYYNQEKFETRLMKKK